MKKKFFSMLVLLAAVATGAWAQTTYTVVGNNSDMFGSAWDAYCTANDMTKNSDGTYSITYTNVYLTEDVQYKVVEDRDWGNAYPDDNRVINIAEAGTYTLTIHFNPTTHEVYETMPGYTVTLAEGTEDADKWTISPASAAENETVTITYAGTKSVKSVTAKRKTTTGNITVYFTDAQNYGDVHVYYWNDGPEWPGTAMTYVETNGYSQKIYKAVIPATAEGIIFNGNGSQTVDITENIADGSWWYATDQSVGANNEVGYVGKYAENIEVTNVDDNKWTFTMPDYDVELEVEYKDGATGIESIDHEPLTIDHWYDLNGRKIQTPKQRGIYINNGKKVVIK